MLQFEYRTARIRDFQVDEDEAVDGEGRQAIRTVRVDGEPLSPSKRFWRSLFHRLGLSENVFRYFRYDEVLARVVQCNRNDSVRLCIRRPDKGTPRLLAVSNPKKPVLRYDEAQELLQQHEAENVVNGEGVISSRHTPRSGWNGFVIGPDQFHNRFVMEVPIDGFGQPRIYLSLLRQICSNGAIGYSRAFRSDLRIGEDAVFTLNRAMGHFDNDEGFAALRQRFESAQSSWASVSEVRQLEKVLVRCGTRLPRGSSIAMSQLRKVSGDLNALYGLSNLESLSSKRQRILPAGCRVYDLLNFASELATHHATGEAQTRLQAYIGSLISDEFDLEGTAIKVPEFKDLFLGAN